MRRQKLQTSIIGAKNRHGVISERKLIGCKKNEPHLFDNDYANGEIHFGQIWYGWSWWDKRYLTLRVQYYEKQFFKAKAARPGESMTNLLQSAAAICAG